VTLLQLSGEGASPSPNPTPMKNYENLTLLNGLMFKFAPLYKSNENNMYYCIRNIAPELKYSLMVKFIAIFWGGGKLPPQTPPQ